MPSFPSYYLNNLERKRQRSRDLSEGLDKGMAGVLGGVDRLTQMQQALEEKGLRAEALKHGRDIEAANQARSDQRFAWEGEDRERRITQGDEDRARKMAREDAAPDRLSQAKDRLDSDAIVVDEKEQRTKKNELIKAAVENAIETGEDPEAMNSRIRDYLADQGILGVGSSEVRAAYGAAKRARGGEALDMRKMEADAAIAERKAKGGGGVPGVTSKKEIDRQLAELRLKAAKAKAAGGGVSTTDVDKVRKEFNALPAVKQYHDVAIAVDKMKNAAKVPSAAGDLSLIFAFMKTLDPTSTVREGEFANAQNATGVPERVLNEYNRVMSGERLNEAQRADFLAQADNFLAAHKKAYDAAAESYGGLATRRGMAPGDVVMGAAAPSADPQAAKPFAVQNDQINAFVTLSTKLGRPPTKEEMAAHLRDQGVLE